jgi:hypothetical protein
LRRAELGCLAGIVDGSDDAGKMRVLAQASCRARVLLPLTKRFYELWRCGRAFAAFAAIASKFSTTQRADFWEHVSYYNFLQEFMSAARVPPSDKAWADGREAFPEVLDALKPDLIIAFGKRLSRHLNKVSGNCPVAKVHHPSTGFSYDRWNPVINAALAQAAQIKRTAVRSQNALPANLNFVEWYETSRRVLPSHGSHLPAATLAEVHMTWAQQMAELRRRRTSAGQR